MTHRCTRILTDDADKYALSQAEGTTQVIAQTPLDELKSDLTAPLAESKFGQALLVAYKEHAPDLKQPFRAVTESVLAAAVRGMDKERRCETVFVARRLGATSAVARFLMLSAAAGYDENKELPPLSVSTTFEIDTLLHRTIELGAKVTLQMGGKNLCVQVCFGKGSCSFTARKPEDLDALHANELVILHGYRDAPQPGASKGQCKWVFVGTP